MKKKQPEKLTRLRNIYTLDEVYTSSLYSPRVIDGKEFIAIFSDPNVRRIMYTNPDAYEKVTK